MEFVPVPFWGGDGVASMAFRASSNLTPGKCRCSCLAGLFFLFPDTFSSDYSFRLARFNESVKCLVRSVQSDDLLIREPFSLDCLHRFHCALPVAHLAMVPAKFEFGAIPMQMLPADMME